MERKSALGLRESTRTRTIESASLTCMLWSAKVLLMCTRRAQQHRQHSVRFFLAHIARNHLSYVRVCNPNPLCQPLAFWTTNGQTLPVIGIFSAAKMRIRLQQQHRHNKGTRHSYIFYIVLLKCNASVVVAILQNIHQNGWAVRGRIARFLICFTICLVPFP
jgi:hypothetical protein